MIVFSKKFFLSLFFFYNTPHVLADSTFFSCPRSFRSLFYSMPKVLSSNATFQDIQRATQQLAKIAPTENIDNSLTDRVQKIRTNFKRLLEPKYDVDDKVALSYFGLSAPEELIPLSNLIKSHADWKEAINFIEKNANNRQVSVDLLKDIHKLACQHMVFYGYEGRRILLMKKQGKLTDEQFRKLLHRAYGNNESVSGVDHQTLVGKFRSDIIDQLSHNGSSFDSNGKRYFTELEFSSISKNEYLELTPDSYILEADGKIRAEFKYYDVSKVEKATTKLLDQTNKTIDANNSLDIKVQAIVKMQKDLASIHPFLDGNGRTIRLLADLLYQRIGLLPPLRPNKRDLEMSTEEATNFVRSQMINYFNQNNTRGAK
jgi:hypothetical protein